MKSRFDFLNEKSPKIAGYGKKAEDCMNSDKNICLLNLGRIAENITELLCEKNKIEIKDPKELLRLGIIHEDIYEKINALTEIKDDAVNEDYESEMACVRLINSSLDLCRWFIAQQNESRFSFLADLFPATDSVPILADLAEFGQEAEQNLFSNTRYSIICMGDIGEAVTYVLLNSKNIPHEKDQIDRIKMLVSRSVIPRSAGDILHNLRMARNQAIHSRYNLEENAVELLDQAFELCEKLFRFLIQPNDIVKGKITGEDENNILVNIGNIPATIEKSEIQDKFDEVETKKIFRVLDVDSEKRNLKLTLKNVTDPWADLERHYEKYQIGQDLNVKIISITKTIGAIVGLKDGLIAKIPDSELGRKMFNRSKGIKYEVKARIKWFNPKRYPYMILSVKDIEDEEKSQKLSAAINSETEKTENVNETVEPMPDSYFVDLCKTANAETISDEISKGADINSRDRNGNTPLMAAAMCNNNHEVLKVLLDSGAKINSRNHKGNTALILAAMSNTHKAVKILLNAGADINVVNREHLKAISYAVSNKKLSNNKSIIKLLKGQKVKRSKPKAKAQAIKQTPKETEVTNVMTKTKEEYQKEFLKICRSGTEEEIQEAINAGVNVNVKNKSLSTALMFAAKNNTASSVEILIKAGAYVDAQDIFGNTALIYAASFNTDDVVEVLIDCGADVEMMNISGNKAIDYAQQNYRLQDTEAIKKL